MSHILSNMNATQNVTSGIYKKSHIVQEVRPGTKYYDGVHTFDLVR